MGGVDDSDDVAWRRTLPRENGTLGFMVGTLGRVAVSSNTLDAWGNPIDACGQPLPVPAVPIPCESTAFRDIDVFAVSTVVIEELC